MTHWLPAALRNLNWIRFPAGEGLVAGVAILVAALISVASPYAPSIHDEFSYLLSADTLLHARLANPSPEIWQPFQSFHILVEPAYASKYPLGPAMVIALGWVLLGTPIAGSWLSAGFCAASITWMLRGLTSGRWALLGGLLIALYPSMQTTWSQSLISGWLTAGACSLVTGGIFRLRRGFSSWPALALGCGVAGLALTRPFEGLVATTLCAATLLYWWSARQVRPATGLRWVGQIACLSGLPVGLALSATLAQNFATTGSLTRMPYQLHEQLYGVAPLFVFGAEKEGDVERAGHLPETIHRYHHGWSLDCFRRRMGWGGWLVGVRESLQLVWSYWLLLAASAVLTTPLWFRFRLPVSLAGMLLLQLLCSSSVCWIFPHYLAPILPWLVALSVWGSRRLCHRFRLRSAAAGRPAAATSRVPPSGARPRYLFPALMVLQLAGLGIRGWHLRQDASLDWARQRAAIDARLRQTPGKHLVLVKYAPDHNVHQEWVYNRADLNGATVVWARDTRPAWTRDLISHYGPERTVWLLEPDRAEPKLKLVGEPSTHRRTID